MLHLLSKKQGQKKFRSIEQKWDSVYVTDQRAGLVYTWSDD
jgi:hypothetical protein